MLRSERGQIQASDAGSLVSGHRRWENDGVTQSLSETIGAPSIAAGAGRRSKAGRYPAPRRPNGPPEPSVTILAVRPEHSLRLQCWNDGLARGGTRCSICS